MLPLAFATNRLDHCDRQIAPWLSGNKGRVVICDRYYLSSLVYQSSEEFSYEQVMKLNEKAMKPDLIFFLNVSDKVCYGRMKIRNQPKELFEKNLHTSRKKYFEAIQFLKENHSETIIEVDGSGSISQVVDAIITEVFQRFPDFKPNQPTISHDLIAPHIFTLNGKMDYTIKDFLDTLPEFEFTEASKEIETRMSGLSFDQLGAIFLDYVKKLGFCVFEKMPWTHLDCYEIEYKLPANIVQRGTALLINETQRYDIIMQSAPQLYEMSDFMIVFSPGPSEIVNTYYERDKIQYKDNNNSVAVALAPHIHIVTQKDLAEFISQRISQFRTLAIA